jgi:hypothetical protein
MKAGMSSAFLLQEVRYKAKLTKDIMCYLSGTLTIL